MRLRWYVLACAVATVLMLAGATSPAGGQEVSGEQVSVSGPITPVTLPFTLHAKRVALDAGLRTPRARVYEMHADGGHTYILTNQSLGPGSASVTGRLLMESNGTRYILATEIDHSTRGRVVERQAFFDQPGEFAGQHIRLTNVSYQRAVLAGDIMDGFATYKFEGGALTTGGHSPVHPPGTVATDVLDRSINRRNQTKFGTWLRLRGAAEVRGERPHTVIGQDRIAYTGGGPATVDLVVNEGGNFSYLASVEYRGQRIADPAAVTRADHGGDRVRLQARGAEARISVKETLIRALPCGEDAFTIGGTCIPAVGDVVVHVGVLYQGQPMSDQDMLPYLAISNRIQTEPVQTGVYDVRAVGTLTDGGGVAQQLDDEPVLYANTLSHTPRDGSAPNAVALRRDDLADTMQRQITTAARGKEVATATPTPTPDPGAGDRVTNLLVTSPLLIIAPLVGLLIYIGILGAVVRSIDWD